MTDARTPGTGGVIDLWKNRDGSPSKLATKAWAEGKGRPQGIGSRWRGWYVGDDGSAHEAVRTEGEADQSVADAKSKLHTKTSISPSRPRDVRCARRAVVRHEGPSQAQDAGRVPSLLDTIVLPTWGDTPLSDVTYARYATWLSGLSVDGSQAGKPLSASRVTQAHQLVGAVLRFALKSGHLARTSPPRSTGPTICRGHRG